MLDGARECGVWWVIWIGWLVYKCTIVSELAYDFDCLRLPQTTFRPRALAIREVKALRALLQEICFDLTSKDSHHKSSLG